MKKNITKKKITSDLLKHLGIDLSKEQPIVNSKLQTHFHKIVDKLIMKTARNEAKKLLKLCNEKEAKDFLYYYHSDSCNVSCMVLDTIKDRLKKENKLPAKIGKKFGTKI